MDKLEQLLAELTATDEKMDALLANDELSEDQHTEHDTLVAGRLKLTASINAERDRLKRADERKALADEAEERKRTAAAGLGRIVDADEPQPGEIPGSRSSDDGIPATAKRHGRIKNFVGTVDGRSPEVRAYRFGQWALARLSMHMPAHFAFKSALDFYEQPERSPQIGGGGFSGFSDVSFRGCTRECPKFERLATLRQHFDTTLAA